jgi:hypothetical protein
VFLLDNGNLRALWKNEIDEQVGLQFLGGCVVQYVIFAQRPNPPMMSRNAGTEALANVLSEIAARGCNHLLFG